MSIARWSPLLCLLLATTAHAQTNVYKCVGGPHPVYQQTPCQGRAEWRWEVPVDQSLSRGVETRVADSVTPKPRVVRRSGGRAALISIRSDPAACDRARQQREKALARNTRLDFVQRRQMDDAVYDACR